ncbi:MAG: hypothetical protein U1G07_14510 [Verrucomicrobiota bacterium]
MSSRIGRGRISGAAWLNGISGQDRTFRLLHQAVLDAADVTLTLTNALYALQCGQLRASLAGSRVEARAVRIQPYVDDETFFAARPFRRARLQVELPKGLFTGIDVAGLLRGTAFRAAAFEVDHATLDAFLNRDKPLNPEPVPLRLLNEYLAAVERPIELTRLSVTNSRIVMSQRIEAGQKPGVMPFAELQITGEGIRNHGPPGATMRFQGRTRLMDAGTLKGSMEIPVSPSAGSFKYAAALNPMDLVVLNPFLMVAGHTRIDSGQVHEAAVEISVEQGHAQGLFRGAYEGLAVTLLDRKTGSEEGVANRVKTFVADKLILRTSNMPEPGATLKSGRVDYIRQPNDKFMRFLWLGIRSGMFDLLGIKPFVGPPK